MRDRRYRYAEFFGLSLLLFGCLSLLVSTNVGSVQAFPTCSNNLTLIISSYCQMSNNGNPATCSTTGVLTVEPGGSDVTSPGNGSCYFSCLNVGMGSASAGAPLVTANPIHCVGAPIVGGVGVAINKLALLAPFIGLGLLAAIIPSIIIFKRRKLARAVSF